MKNAGDVSVSHKLGQLPGESEGDFLGAPPAVPRGRLHVGRFVDAVLAGGRYNLAAMAQAPLVKLTPAARPRSHAMQRYAKPSRSRARV